MDIFPLLNNKFNNKHIYCYIKKQECKKSTCKIVQEEIVNSQILLPSPDIFFLDFKKIMVSYSLLFLHFSQIKDIKIRKIYFLNFLSRF